MASNKDEIILSIRPRLEGADLEAIVRQIHKTLESLGKTMPEFSNETYKSIFKGISDAASVAATATNKSLASIDTSSVKGKADEIANYWNRSMKALMPKSIPLGSGADTSYVRGISATWSQYQKQYSGIAIQANQANQQFSNFITGMAGAARAAQQYQGAIGSASNATAAATAANRNYTQSFWGLAGAFGVGYSAADMFQRALSAVWKEAKEGIMYVDKLRLQAASMAGAMLISQPGMNYDQALANANQLIEKSVIMSRSFVGSARDLQLLTEAAVTFGLQLDFTTQKGKDQFIAFANMLKLITQGQNFEIQAFQEIRAIMQGQNFQGAMLARRLQAVGVNVQEMVPLWVKQGTVIEEIINRLGGYQKATGTIQNTLEAQRKTLMSIASMTLAKGLGWSPDIGKMTGAYADIRDIIKKINDYLMDTNDFTKKQKEYVEDIKKGYESFKNMLTGIYWVSWGIYNVFKMWYDLMNLHRPVLEKMLDKLENSKFGKGLNAWARASEPEQQEYSLVDKLTTTWAESEDPNKKYLSQMYKWALSTKKSAEEIAKIKKQATDYIEGELWASQESAYMKGIAYSPGASQTPPDKEWLEWLRKLQAFKAKVNSEITQYLSEGGEDAYTALIEKNVQRVNDQFKEMFTFDEKGRREDSDKFKRLLGENAKEAHIILSLYYRAKAAAEVDGQKQYADLVAKAQRETREFLRDWENQTSTALLRGADSVEAAEKAARDKVYKAFEDFFARPDIASHYKDAGYTKEEIEKKKKEYADMAASVAGATVRMRNELRKISQDEKVDALTEKLKFLRREAEIPVAWPWNEREVANLEDYTNALNAYETELRKIAVAEKQWRATRYEENPQGMSPEEADSARVVAEETFALSLKRSKERNDATTQAIARAWQSVYNGINQTFATLFEDTLKGHLNSFAEYVWTITDTIRKAWAQMTADMLTEWMRTQGKMMAQKSLAAIGNFLFPSAATGVWAAEGAVFPGHFTPIRAFAGGGIVDRPTFGVIGEGGGPEAVIPLAGGSVPVELRGGQNVKVEIINQTGIEAKASDAKVRFNGQEMIVSVWLDAYHRNAYGLRSSLGG